MKSLRALFLALLLTAGVTGTANAEYKWSGTPFVYAKVSWLFYSSVYPFSSCNEIVVDFNGLFSAYPISFAQYGAVNCPAIGGAYIANGNGYVGTDGTFNMILTFKQGWSMNCVRLSEATLSGTCSLYDPTAVYRGTAQILFL